MPSCMARVDDSSAVDHAPGHAGSGLHRQPRVLIIRLGAFGDIIHTLPLAADLAAAGWEVDWLCEDRWAVLLQGGPVINRVHAIDRRQLKLKDGVGSLLYSLGILVRKLRERKYDAVIDAQGLAKSALFALASGARQRSGHAISRARELSWLVSRRRASGAAVHVIDQQRALGSTLGLRARGGWRFPLPPWSAERAWSRAWLDGAVGVGVRPVVLNVGAGWPTKVWPETRQAEFAGLCKNGGIPLVFSWGGTTEGEVAARIAAAAGHGVVAPPTTIPQLAGVIAQAAVLVSGDTGPLHLALALGTPALGLFGPVPAQRNGPRGRGYRTAQAPGAAWERRDVAKVDMGALAAADMLDLALAAAAEGGRSLQREDPREKSRNLPQGTTAASVTSANGIRPGYAARPSGQDPGYAARPSGQDP